MNTIEIIQSLCFKYRYLRELQAQQQERFAVQRGQLIQGLKSQIWKLKREYLEERERRKAKGMLYEYDGRFFLASREITWCEFMEYRRLRSLKVA
jgi:hypothetical protein